MVPVRIGIRLVAAVAFAAALPAVAPAEDAAPPAPAEGAFEKLAPEIGGLVRFGLDRATLFLDRDPGAKVAKRITDRDKDTFARAMAGPIERLEAKGGGSGGGGTSGMFAWGISFRGDAFEAEVSSHSGKVLVRLRELKPPARSREVRDDGSGGLDMSVTADGGGLFLALHQAQSGRIDVALIRGETTFVASAESFADLWRRHRDDIDTKLIPLLAGLGVSVPPPTRSDGVQEAVLARLRPLADSV
jgi:hypothetical protein